MSARLEQLTLLGRHQAKKGVRPVCVVRILRERVNQLRAVGRVFQSRPDALPSALACLFPSDGGLDGVARLAGAGNQFAADSVDDIGPSCVNSGPAIRINRAERDHNA